MIRRHRSLPVRLCSLAVAHLFADHFLNQCGPLNFSSAQISLLSSDFLPEDCLLQILRSLSHNDLSRLACVNREFEGVSRQDALWEPLCRKEYNVCS